MSSKAKVFIDGEAGTTGLQIAARLASRNDLELLQIETALRKDPARRQELLNLADVVVLCLPDAAAIAAVALINNPNTAVIDASTAHRTAPGWEYGFTELAPPQRARLSRAKRIANPGCYAIGAVSILHPLISAGLVPADWPCSIHAVSGYSGGGKALIAAFEDQDAPDHTDANVYDYALTLEHKHLPEITRWSGLNQPPVFLPAVGRYRQGMLVHLPLALWALPRQPGAEDIHAALQAHYAEQHFVTVMPLSSGAELGQIDPEALNGTNELRLYVLHNNSSRQAIVVAQLDNLGKGASGQAVQSLNLLIGADETSGL